MERSHTPSSQKTKTIHSKGFSQTSIKGGKKDSRAARMTETRLTTTETETYQIPSRNKACTSEIRFPPPPPAIATFGKLFPPPPTPLVVIEWYNESERIARLNTNGADQLCFQGEKRPASSACCFRTPKEKRFKKPGIQDYGGRDRLARFPGSDTTVKVEVLFDRG